MVKLEDLECGGKVKDVFPGGFVTVADVGLLGKLPDMQSL